MSDLPWLTVLFAVPLLGALAVALMPRSSATLLKQVGIGVALLTAAVAVAIAAQFDVDGGMQLTETHTWIEAFGVHYALGIDGLGLLLVLLTVVLVPVVLLGAWDDGAEDPRAFVAWTLALEGLSLAVFTATDVFLFYVVFEATLIPAYFLIGGFGRVGRSAAAVKFLMFQLVGGLVLLAAVIGLYVVSADAGTPSYLLSDLMALDIDTTAGRWLFAGFFIAFAIKAPLFPVHTWLADTTEKATPGTSILLVCVLDKIGTFGMLRFCLGIFPEASQWATPLVVVIALISIVYGALVAIGQDDLLRLIGLTSLSHFGFITLGIFAMSTLGGSGAVLYMVNHGLGTAALFLVAGYLIRRRGTTLISEMGGYERTMPVLAGLFLVAGLATLSLPGLSPFVSEFLVIVAAFDYHWLAGAVAVTGIVLAAIYVLWAYQRIMTGPGRVEVETDPSTEPGTPVPVGAPVGGPAGAPEPGAAPAVTLSPAPAALTTRDLGVREVVAAAPLVVGLVLFGFWPMPLLDVSNPTVESLLSHVGVSDDPPQVDESAAIVGETEEGH
ncbi:NADH-quinone oxidoreductase subunit M [Nocardioides sp. dk4132]|uniref:NADH-quinone oxidoreductase subunit M n=1 Tax=unclassified Nocardioides TaxID=2615069 RepID=UPI0012955191|nr:MULTISPECIES: NADH-quinone oxidoreductase subunit M [unclassified Nocardioides]MQW74506.1 NADH-quinone oxidoreductase subunit M [Nocardioides sp. dk4132]QGA06435.1 NADH-quinone oxidoreductase subunit M [Nocardioides sp. dk884]